MKEGLGIYFLFGEIYYWVLFYFFYFIRVSRNISNTFSNLIFGKIGGIRTKVFVI